MLNPRPLQLAQIAPLPSVLIIDVIMIGMEYIPWGIPGAVPTCRYGSSTDARYVVRVEIEEEEIGGHLHDGRGQWDDG